MGDHGIDCMAMVVDPKLHQNTMSELPLGFDLGAFVVVMYSFPYTPYSGYLLNNLRMCRVAGHVRIKRSMIAATSKSIGLLRIPLKTC